MELALLALASYVIGSVPFGLLVGKAWGKDIRGYGSGKTGATNALRTLGRGAAALVLVGDTAKGAVAVLVARLLFPTPAGEAVAGLAAIAGHNWPFYLRFRGGRGVSTGLGAALVMAPWAGLLSLAVAAIVIALFRYVSLGSLLGFLAFLMALALLTALGREPLAYLAFAIAAAGIVVFQHRDNIQRLLKGTERVLGERAEPFDKLRTPPFDPSTGSEHSQLRTPPRA
ncbi:MAG: glycerol-3-phosphate 1-O-acyltransferase PlsY [Chloroflexota bacterium]|nr:glycerol-3-phosphate 1-O-acyltransferase PlsY [Chloroflexota bacterium]